MVRDQGPDLEKKKKRRGKKKQHEHVPPDRTPEELFAGVSGTTGRPNVIQDKLDRRLWKCNKSKILDLSCAVASNAFRFDFTAVPQEVFSNAKLSSTLRELWLTNNKIPVITYEIRALRSLRVLGLGGNKLTSLPPDIGALPGLERLCAENNMISSLPAEITNLKQLRELRLDNNKLNSFAEITGMRSLQRLGLSSNKLTMIPRDIRQMTNLSELDLDNNKIEEVPGEMSRLGMSLQQLGLASNLLAEKPAFLDEMENLVIVRLEGNRAPGFVVKDPNSGEVLQGVNVPVRHDGFLQLKTGGRDLEGHLSSAKDYNMEGGLFATEMFTDMREILQARVHASNKAKAKVTAAVAKKQGPVG
jgi:Leucine-rich repeat (LRR) protein